MSTETSCELFSVVWFDEEGISSADVPEKKSVFEKSSKTCDVSGRGSVASEMTFSVDSETAFSSAAVLSEIFYCEV